MSFNKENIKGDLKKFFKFIYITVRVVLHLCLFGAVLFYAGYVYSNANVKEWSLFASFLVLLISGVLTIGILTVLFHGLHYIEIRYFKNSYRMAYILFKYITPHLNNSLDGIDYDTVCQGYEEVVRRGNAYYGIKESDGDSNEKFN